MEKKLCKQRNCRGFEGCEITAEPAIHAPATSLDIIAKCKECGKVFNTFAAADEMVLLNGE